MTPSSDIFVADADGFRAQNADRPPEHLVRELVQNALDEDGVTALDITVQYHGPRRGTTVVVKDNAPLGVKNIKTLFTLWLSDKEDSPTKRGRMGRGLKELVSVADQTIIRSCSQDALLFKRHKGGRWVRQVKPKLGRPETGTEVTAFVRGWDEKASKGIVAFLKRVRAPGTVTMRVAYHAPGVERALERIAPFTAPETYRICLETVVYEVADGERKARERWVYTPVECFAPPPGESAQVYEMGIPVEECDGPVSIDVGQRVILRERRDALTEAYKRSLFASVLSARIDKLSDADLRDSAALTAAQDIWQLSTAAKERIARVWTDGKPYASTPAMKQAATAHHIEFVNLRALPEAVREIVKGVGSNVQAVLDARRSEFCPPLTDLSAEQKTLVALWEWIAKGIGRPCQVKLCKGTPGALADFDRAEQTLRVYVNAVDGRRFRPASAYALGILIHECAHWGKGREDEHGPVFHTDADDVGGMVAAFLLNNAEQARLLVRP